MEEGFEIQKGIASDAKALSVLSAETFCENFAHFYTPIDLKTYLESNHTEQLQLAELEKPDCETLLILHKENIVGYCMIRFGSREEQIKGPDPVAEIWRFYISKALCWKRSCANANESSLGSCTRTQDLCCMVGCLGK